MMDQNSTLSNFSDILKRVFIYGNRDTILSFYIHFDSTNDAKMQNNFGLKGKEGIAIVIFKPLRQEIELLVL